MVICRSGLGIAEIEVFVQSVALLLRAGNIPPPYRRNGSRSAIEDLEWFKSVGANSDSEEKKAERGAGQRAKVMRFNSHLAPFLLKGKKERNLLRTFGSI